MGLDSGGTEETHLTWEEIALQKLDSYDNLKVIKRTLNSTQKFTMAGKTPSYTDGQLNHWRDKWIFAWLEQLAVWGRLLVLIPSSGFIASQGRCGTAHHLVWRQTHHASPPRMHMHTGHQNADYALLQRGVPFPSAEQTEHTVPSVHAWKSRHAQ